MRGGAAGAGSRWPGRRGGRGARGRPDSPLRRVDRARGAPSPPPPASGLVGTRPGRRAPIGRMREALVLGVAGQLRPAAGGRPRAGVEPVGGRVRAPTGRRSRCRWSRSGPSPRRSSGRPMAPLVVAELERRIGQVRQRGEARVRPDLERRLLDPLSGGVRRAVRNRRRVRLATRQVLDRDRPDVRVADDLGDRGVTSGRPARPSCCVISSSGAGHELVPAAYDARPVALTSCSVPVWISVESVAVQPESMQPPPIPIQSEESSAWPCGVLGGGRHRPVAGDRVEQLAPLLERALVVAEPVAARVRVATAGAAPGAAADRVR